MRKRLFVLINVLVLLVSIINPDIAYAKTTFREASIDAFEGTVKVIIAGGQKEYTAYKGMGLTQGDTVITSAKSSVTLYIDDDKEVMLGENSRLTLSELSNYIDSESKATGLKLWVGKIWVDVKKKLNIRSKFEITTGSTVMGVKGTQFFVGYEPVDSFRDLEEGTVRIQTLQTGIHEYHTELAVLSGTVTAMVAAPSFTSQEGSSPLFNMLAVHANQTIEFTEDDIAHPQLIQVQPLQPQNLDLLVLERIAENPQNFDERLFQNLEELIQQGREQAEREQRQRLEELMQSLELRQMQQATQRPQYLNPPPAPPVPPQTLYTPQLPPVPPTPSIPPMPSTPPALPAIIGNETVMIDYPTGDTIVNTMQGVNLELTATDHEKDLDTVKVSVKNEQGNYLGSASGDFTSDTPVYLNAVKNGSKWNLLLNGAPFTSEREFECTVKTIAYDGADGTPTTVSFRVDNVDPELLSCVMPMELYPSTQGQNKPTQAVLRFTEKLSTSAKTSVVNKITNAVITDTPEISGSPQMFGSAEDLNFSWTYDDSQHDEILTVTIRTDNSDNPTPKPVLFRDVEDIMATIVDLAGHENTVVIYEVDALSTEGNIPKYVQIEKNGENNRYYTSSIQYYVPLPVGMDIADFNLQGEEWNNYISLGGALAGNTVDTANIEYIDNRATLRIIGKGDNNNNMWVVGEGQGTIIVSNRLMQDNNAQDDYELPTKPICATVTLSKEAFGMSHEWYIGDGMEDPTILDLGWDTTKGIISDIYIIENSSEEYLLQQDEPITIEGSDAEISIEYFDMDGDNIMELAVIRGLKMNQKYRIRGCIDEGEYRGYTKVINYTPEAISDVVLYQLETKQKMLPMILDLIGGKPEVENEAIADVSYSTQSNRVTITGKKPGETEVLLIGYSANLNKIIKYTFNVMVEEPTVIQASVVSPGAITHIKIDGEKRSFNDSIIVELPDGYSFEDCLEGFLAENYIIFKGALGNVGVSRIENVDGAPNRAEIVFTTFNDYIVLENVGQAEVQISGSLLKNGDLSKVIKTSVMIY